MRSHFFGGRNTGRKDSGSFFSSVLPEQLTGRSTGRILPGSYGAEITTGRGCDGAGGGGGTFVSTGRRDSVGGGTGLFSAELPPSGKVGDTGATGAAAASFVGTGTTGRGASFTAGRTFDSLSDGFRIAPVEIDGGGSFRTGGGGITTLRSFRVGCGASEGTASAGCGCGGASTPSGVGI